MAELSVGVNYRSVMAFSAAGITQYERGLLTWNSYCEESQETEVLPLSVAGTVKVAGPSRVCVLWNHSSKGWQRCQIWDCDHFGVIWVETEVAVGLRLFS